MTQETLKKLAQLLEQDQFELILPENVQPDETKIEGEGTRGRDIRLVYLMNDAAESFLVFRNARMTGEYHSEYQGHYGTEKLKTEKIDKVILSKEQWENETGKIKLLELWNCISFEK